ncbi:MAG: hypothetical protein D6772_01365 [Bacteroidetes bacterium]|nr:MAG: hypothetical protein D6772_01365 [Bacteroidota bacterium]
MTKAAKTLTFLMGLLILLSSATALSAQEQEWTEKSLQQMYLDFLGEEGYRPEVDGDGDVRFKSEGLTYFIDVDEGDTEYFAIMLANIYEVESAEERIRALEACNTVSSTAKVIKGQIINDYIWLTAEVFVPDPRDFKSIFSRTMAALQAAQDTLEENL